MGAERFRVIARAIILSPDRRIVLVSSQKGEGLVLPGGAVDRGETLPQAAIREAKEECGLDVVVASAIWVREFFSRERDRANLEVYFLARPTVDDPFPDRWLHDDPDTPGLTRECGLYTHVELASTPMAVYPLELRDAFWAGLEQGFGNMYLGRYESGD